MDEDRIPLAWVSASPVRRPTPSYTCPRVSRGATIPPVALADIACPESRRRVGDTVGAAAA
jgi:hypothetical protein